MISNFLQFKTPDISKTLDFYFMEKIMGELKNVRH